MNKNNNCYKCNSPIRNNITLCDTCRSERNNAAAILATNKKALKYLNKYNNCGWLATVIESIS